MFADQRLKCSEGFADTSRRPYRFAVLLTKGLFRRVQIQTKDMSGSDNCPPASDDLDDVLLRGTGKQIVARINVHYPVPVEPVEIKQDKIRGHSYLDASASGKTDDFATGHAGCFHCIGGGNLFERNPGIEEPQKAKFAQRVIILVERTPIKTETDMYACSLHATDMRDA